MAMQHTCEKDRKCPYLEKEEKRGPLEIQLHSWSFAEEKEKGRVTPFYRNFVPP